MGVVGVDNFDKLIRSVRVERARVLLGIHKMRADVIFDHFDHESGDSPADAGDHVHDVFATGLFIESPLDCFNLAFDPTDPSEQFFLLSNRMAHWPIWPTPMLTQR